MKVIIDPRSNYSYSSFYLLELEKLAGKGNVIYSMAPFRELDDLDRCMRFVVQKGENKINFFLHLNDPYRISEPDYEWCDVYGSVNANYGYYPPITYSKLVSLAPSFGIRYETSFLKAMFNSMMTLFRTWKYVVGRKEWNKSSQSMERNIIVNFKKHFTRRYKTWKNRLPLSAYDSQDQSEDKYVFFLSTLWYNDEWNQNDKTVNLRRASFIRACKSISGITFDGGLLGDKFSSVQKFSDVLAEKGEAFHVWLEKTKRSALVFNTPAFWNCHGWKLGEYLALGKCIVSTPLSNDLPYPLEHGVNIHFVKESEQSIKEAVEYILSHPDYRHKLERGARAYWEKWGSPKASFKILGIL